MNTYEVSTYRMEHLGSIPGVERDVSVLCYSQTDSGGPPSPKSNS